MIICVEDEQNICELEVYTLQSVGFQAKGCGSGKELFAELEHEIPELILLDIMLPDEDGLSILGKLRSDKRYAAIPVIMATAKGSEFDKVKGLDSGADDYIAKPFGMLEMVSRIKAVLRRCGKEKQTGDIIKVEDLIVNLSEHTVTVGSENVILTLKEYELLKNQGIINLQNKIIYPEFISYFSSQYFLQDCSWKDAISNKIIPIIKNSEKLSDMHIQMIYEIFSYCKKIDDISFILKQLDNLLENKITRLQNKVITNIIYQCYRKNNELFFNYINQIDINTYSLELQKYLLKLSAELCPALLSKWEDENNILSYSAFIFKSDILYKYLEEHLPKTHDNLFGNYISSENGILLLLHLLTYWGWDNNDRYGFHHVIN